MAQRVLDPNPWTHAGERPQPFPLDLTWPARAA
jgi:hypothetical protein